MKRFWSVLFCASMLWLVPQWSFSKVVGNTYKSGGRYHLILPPSVSRAVAVEVSREVLGGMVLVIVAPMYNEGARTMYVTADGMPTYIEQVNSATLATFSF